MSDQDESRPLTRREMRLREMAAAGVEPEGSPAADEAAESAQNAAPALEIEISAFDDDGRQRSRREIRELREQAQAALLAEAEAERAAEAERLAAAEAERVAAEEAAAAERLAAEQAEAERRAEEVAAAEAERVAAEEAAAKAEAERLAAEKAAAEEAAERQAAAEAAEAERLAAEQAEAERLAAERAEAERIKAAESARVAEEERLAAEAAEAQAVPDAEPELDTVAFDVVADQAEAESEGSENDLSDSDAEAVDESDAVEAETDEVSDGADVDEEDGDSSEPEPVASKQEYSFPDITPLDDGQSIFDDPAIRMMGAANAQQQSESADGGDFDDLISRAVAQENATSTTNTSALILPTMPDSDGISGPLGDSGELFITGSFDLPKSLSETGGHSALHDSVEMEPLDELGFSEPAPEENPMAPVSASRAVSARGRQGPLVAEATKDKSKLPLVLIGTGGVLVVGAVGLVIWAATSGLFG